MLRSLTVRRLLVAGLVASAAACSGGGDTIASSTTEAAPPTTTEAAPPTTAGAAPPTTVASPATTAAPAPSAPASTAPRGTIQPAATAPGGGPAKRISKGANGRPIVALSFDAGSDVGYAGEILDLLKADGIHASFGVTGKWAEKNPDLFRRIVAEGHHLINHTYDHQSMTGRSTGRLALSRSARAEELQKADDVFVRLAGRSAKPWFRPPYGDIDPDLDAVLGEQGYRYDTLWSLDSLGWKGLSAAQITARCTAPGALFPGAILLFHVGAQSQDAAALPAVIAAIRAAGLEPGSVADLM